MLDEAQKTNPDASWWLKMDGCDLVEGLGESVDQVWTGDVDLADGALQEKHKCYMERLTFVSNFGLTNFNSDVALCEKQFTEDYSFLTTSKPSFMCSITCDLLHFSPQDQE